MERPNDSRISAQVHEAASEWFVEFRTGEPSEPARRAFLAWLRESPVHMRAYLEVTALWSDTASVNQDGRWTVDELIREAERDSDNVIALENAESAARVSQQERAGRRHRLRIAMLSAAASILVLMLAGLAQWYLARGTYSTGTGEQRSIALADGSTVQLNARSKLRVRFSKAERDVELIRGQALFHVAKDAARPFIVVSDGTRVRAVGTQFDVYRKPRGTVVTVLEGKVAVSADESAPRRDDFAMRNGPQLEPVYLSAGEQIALSSAAPVVTKQINAAAVTAWTQRQLIFDATPLAEVAEEFNRYNERQLVVRNPALETFQIDGVFSSTDTSSLLKFLRTRPGLRVTETDSQIVLDLE